MCLVVLFFVFAFVIFFLVFVCLFVCFLFFVNSKILIGISVQANSTLFARDCFIIGNIGPQASGTTVFVYHFVRFGFIAPANAKSPIFVSYEPLRRGISLRELSGTNVPQRKS